MPDNVQYLRTKQTRMGHVLGLPRDVPLRVVSLDPICAVTAE